MKINRLCSTTMLAGLAVSLALTASAAVAGGGPLWTPVLTGSNTEFADGVMNNPARIVPDPTNAATIYVTTGATLTPGIPSPPADGLWKSVDGGLTWASINEPSTGDPGLDFFELTADTNTLDLAVCAANPQVLVAATNPKGFFKSTDGGASWSWISSGIVHTSADADHCAAIQHADETFGTVGGRWTATSVAFDPTNCDVIFGAVGDVNAVDYSAGTGDHPGLFKSEDGGATWVDFNAGFGKRVDAIACHALDPTSKTVAPVSIKATADRILVASSEQAVDSGLFEKTATTHQRVWRGLHAGPLQEVSDSLESATEVVQSAMTGDLHAISTSVGFLSAAPSGSFFSVSHTGIGTVIAPTGGSSMNLGAGLFGTRDASVWLARDTGIPVVTDSRNDNSTNVGPMAVNPVNENILVAGTYQSDGAGPDRSQVFASGNRGASWINTNSVVFGLSESPTGFVESSILFVEWDAAGACVYALVWWDLGTSSTVDDGVYKVCPF